MAKVKMTPDLWRVVWNLFQDRADEYENFYQFFNGEQDLPVDSLEFKSRFGAFFKNFRDNLARPIIESAESRVRIIEFGDGTGIAADAETIWRRNKMKAESKRVHTEAMVKGDAFVIVLPREDGKSGIYPQVSETCAIVWNDVDPRVKDVAIKWWVEDFYPHPSSTPQPFVRINFYFADRIERYRSTASDETLTEDWTKYEVYTDEGAWKTRHKVKQVPMFQFSPSYNMNLARGRSDLADATSLVDGINKTILDMMTASEFTAAPQRWATGVEIPLDPQTGEPVESYTSGADRLWTAPSDGARFGQFASGDLSAYKDAVGVLVDHLAFVTRTPVYALMREVNYPSGESLKSAEAPLRSRVADHQDDFGEVWPEVLAAALLIDKITVQEEDLPDLYPHWLPVNAPFATREFLEEIKVKAEVAGIPEEMLWRELNYTAAQIDEMKTMREDQANLGLDAAANVQNEALLAGGAPVIEGGVVEDIAPTEASSPLATP